MDYCLEDFLAHFQQPIAAIASENPAVGEADMEGLGDWFALAHRDPDAALAPDNAEQIALRLVWLLFLVDLHRLKQRVAPATGHEALDVLSFALSDLTRLVGRVDPHRGARLEEATYNARRLLRDRYRRLSAGSAEGAAKLQAGTPGG